MSSFIYFQLALVYILQMNVLIDYSLFMLAFVLLIIASFSRKGVHGLTKDGLAPVRGLLAVGIILCHCTFMCEESAPVLMFEGWGAVIVSIFFFMSGMGLVKSYKSKGAKYLNGFKKKSLLKLLPSLIMATLVWFPTQYYFIRVEYSFSDLLKGVPPLNYSWFVYMLIAYYLCFYLVFKIIDNKHVRLLAMLVVSFIFAFLFRMMEWGVFWSLSLFAFNTGTYFGEYENAVISMLNKHRVLSLLAISGTLCVLMIFRIRSGGQAFIPIALLVPLMILPVIKSNALMLLGSVSYEIYLCHGIFVPLFGHYFTWWPLVVWSLTCSIIGGILLNNISGRIKVRLDNLRLFA